MLENVATVLEKVKEDIMSIWSIAPWSTSLSTDTVFIGRPRLPLDEDHAVITLSDGGITRSNTGPRARQEFISVDIEGNFEWVEDVDLLVQQLSLAKALGDFLCPPATSGGGGLVSPSDYAGVGRGMKISRIECPSPEDSDKFYKVILTFQVTVDAAAE